MGSSLLIWDYAALNLASGARLLDLGCGYGHLADIVHTHWAAFRGTDAPVPEIHGVDRHAPNVDLCRRGGRYARVYEDDAVGFLRQQATGAFSTVLALELVEHLPKEDGSALLDEAQRVASDRVILSTPNQPDFRGPGVDLDGAVNQHDAHLSAWHSTDFRTRGYSVMGCRPAFRDPRGPAWQNRLLGWFETRYWRSPRARDLWNAWVVRHPRTATYILCWKDMRPGIPSRISWLW